ncbi:MAG: hypothetical protein KGZ97_09180 [Bacteroidetes bacterium]|nr:hypothetical protein [Bacteroidota bacterium]
MNKTNIITFITILNFLFSFSKTYSNNNEFWINNHSIYLEIGGNAGLYSLNYDVNYYSKNINSFGGRFGLAVIPSSTLPSVFPFEIYGLLGKTYHFIEYGLGYTQIFYLVDQSLNPSSIILARLGYRYQKRQKGIMYRIGFTPILKNATDKFGVFRLTPFAGISIGWAF